jgi:oligo-1,6-glucosidase
VWPKQALKYIDEETGQMDMMIQFQCQCADCFFTDYMPTKFDLRKLKRAFSSWQHQLEGRAWNMLYMENHDHPRIISRYGSEKFWAESGKMLAAAYLFQKGTPFVYQGQEIGMLNWQPEDPPMYEDVQTRWQYENTATGKSPRQRLERLWRSSRDSARTPVQWDDTANAGFTPGEPWFYVNSNYPKINVAQQEQDPNSILNFYRKAIQLRKTLPVVRHGNYREHFSSSSKVYCYSRQMPGQKLLVLCSFAGKPVSLPVPKDFDLGTGKLILGNYPGSCAKALRPYETRVYLWED